MKFEKTVLILCYDFPPLNTVGALRPYSWYRYLSDFNIHPVIVTRHWPSDIKTFEQKFTSHKSKTEILETSQGTIVKAGKNPGLKDKVIGRYGLKKQKALRKLLTFRNFALGPFIDAFDDYHFIYLAAEKYLQNQSVDLILATGNPHELFKEASKLSKKFTIPWIADYRDPYSKNVSIQAKGFQKVMEAYKRMLERKWTKNMGFFTTVSPVFLENIQHTIHKPGFLVRNGFQEDLLPDPISPSREKFVVTYVGTVYDSWYTNAFIQSIDLMLKDSDLKEHTNFQFIGIELNHTGGTDSIHALQKRFPENIEILENRKNEDVLKEVNQSHLLINLKYGSDDEGIIPVKLYEYLALNKIILSFEKTKAGRNQEFADHLQLVGNPEEAYSMVKQLFDRWKNGEALENSIDKHWMKVYSREHQAGILADLIKNQPYSQDIN